MIWICCSVRWGVTQDEKLHVCICVCVCLCGAYPHVEAVVKKSREIMCFLYTQKSNHSPYKSSLHI